jgi:hypothetical protein
MVPQSLIVGRGAPRAGSTADWGTGDGQPGAEETGGIAGTGDRLLWRTGPTPVAGSSDALVTMAIGWGPGGEEGGSAGAGDGLPS